MFTSNYLALVKLGLLNPQLMRLAWRLKRSRKTYLSYPKLLSFLYSFRLLQVRHGTPLQMAEFGVGRGGSAIFLAWLVGRYGGTLTLYDIFGRIPAPAEIDGERARDRYNHIVNNEGADYYGNIPNLLNLILGELRSVCDLDQIEIIQGRFEDTLSKQTKHRLFDFVHIDCDWYESSKAVLSYLQQNLRPGAIIQIDDYSNWKGSRAAVNEAKWLEHFKQKLVDGALVIDTGKDRSN
jgi:SAM-dependent methyltransferase